VQADQTVRFTCAAASTEIPANSCLLSLFSCATLDLRLLFLVMEHAGMLFALVFVGPASAKGVLRGTTEEGVCDKTARREPDHGR
jgi:hypothetical protein